jgi:hypothetical protein
VKFGVVSAETRHHKNDQYPKLQHIIAGIDERIADLYEARRDWSHRCKGPFLELQKCGPIRCTALSKDAEWLESYPIISNQALSVHNLV